MTREIAARTFLRGIYRACTWAIWPILTLGITTAIGCDGGTRVNPPPDESYLRGMVRAYSTAARDLGRPPKDIEEIKAVFTPLGSDSPKYVRSPRDGEEFVVIWGLDLNSAPGHSVVAYERKGADGKRMVVTADSTVKEVSDDELRQMKFPKDYKPEI
jgi:hypothetical protein